MVHAGLIDSVFTNSQGEQFRVEHDERGWYARSVDKLYHVSLHYSSLSEAILAGDLSVWLPLDNLVESRR